MNSLGVHVRLVFCRVRDDLRFTWRLMRRAPWFYASVMLPLVAGIGSITAMLSVVQSVLLAPLPFPDADRLVMSWSVRADGSRALVSLPDFVDWSLQARSVERLAAVNQWPTTLAKTGERPTPINLGMVTGEFFALMGTKPLIGRLLDPSDERANAPCRVVLSEALFAGRFDSDERVLGSSVRLTEMTCTVVGVAEKGFDFVAPEFGPASLWVSLAAMSYYHESLLKRRDDHVLRVLGKLQRGVSREAAERDLSNVALGIQSAHSGHDLGVRVVDLHEEMVGSARPVLGRLSAAIAVAFLALCFNVGSLFLVRAQARRAEVALRGALGATRARVAQQLLTEIVTPFLLAICPAWLWAAWLAEALYAMGVRNAGRSWPSLQMDVRSLLAAFLCALGAGLAFGMLPALSLSRTRLSSTLMQTWIRGGEGRSQQRVRGALVAIQIGLGCALLTLSGAAVREAVTLVQNPLGFDPRGLVYVTFFPPAAKYDGTNINELYERMRALVGAQPGVRSASVVSTAPMFAIHSYDSFESAEKPLPAAERAVAVPNVVTPGYFDTLGIPLTAGRDFNASDSDGAERVVIVGASLAQRLFPGQDPLGQRIAHYGWFGPLPILVIGVAGDVRRSGFSGAFGGEAYLPMAQYRHPGSDLVIRFEPDRAAASAVEIQRWLEAADPELVVDVVRPFSVGLDRSVQRQRRLAITLAAFAATAALLAVLGVFGLVSHVTTQRLREFGIRSALGSPRLRIVWLVLGSGLGWIALGVSLGGLAVQAYGWWVARELAVAGAFSLQAFCASALLLTTCALAACIGPALSAVRVPPALALRQD